MLAVADPGEGGPPPLFLDQNEARRAAKKNFEAVPPPPPPLYLKVWIRHWLVPVSWRLPGTCNSIPGLNNVRKRYPLTIKDNLAISCYSV